MAVVRRSSPSTWLRRWSSASYHRNQAAARFKVSVAGCGALGEAVHDHGRYFSGAVWRRRPPLRPGSSRTGTISWA